jgi:hypothetical protein
LVVGSRDWLTNGLEALRLNLIGVEVVLELATDSKLSEGYRVHVVIVCLHPDSDSLADSNFVSLEEYSVHWLGLDLNAIA